MNSIIAYFNYEKKITNKDYRIALKLEIEERLKRMILQHWIVHTPLYKIIIAFHKFF